jgi:hypothetical protein
VACEQARSLQTYDDSVPHASCDDLGFDLSHSVNLQLESASELELTEHVRLMVAETVV